jgi:exonuclease SbcD
MRILHTADWHLGVSSGPVSRADDHAYFLDWLVGSLRDEAVDALVIAGDVFDSHQPSAAALAQYYGFLSRCHAEVGIPIVVVGGNHDAPSRLQAPAELLGTLDIHVRGGLTRDSVKAGDHLVPLRGRSGEVEAVVLAVPYVNEFRLGVRTTDPDRAEVRRSFLEAFGELYTEVTDAAVARWPGVPIVATGHLTAGEGITREDYPLEIHQVGSIDALPPSVFDARIDYVALGHIHRSYPVERERPVWYSGTPVATSIAEASTPRRVLVVDVEGAGAGVRVDRREVPAPRALIELRGELEEVVDRLRGLTWTEPFPPLLYVRVRQDDPPTALTQRLQEALDAHPDDARPALVEVRHESATSLGLSEPGEGVPLDRLEVGEVFARMARAGGAEPDEGLRGAFDAVRSMAGEELEERARRIREGLDEDS